MEMIIGCIFLGIILIIFTVFVKNINLTIKIEYPTPQYIELKDQFDSDGNLLNKDETASIDSILKEVNNIMLDREDDSDE